ncbi:hypothetical protein NKH77_17845 [Streptomyces sp. M19]
MAGHLRGEEQHRLPQLRGQAAGPEVDVVTTDDVILAGYRARHADALGLASGSLTTENYGVGMPKGDDALKHLTCGRSTR